MSLSNRLKNLQQVDHSTLSDLSQLTLDDLHQEKVTFGEKHMGKTFQEVWKDQNWIHFVASRYGKSAKAAHRLLIRYIELMVEHHETQQLPILVDPNADDQLPVSLAQGQRPAVIHVTPKAKAKPLAQTRSMTVGPIEAHLPDMEERLPKHTSMGI